MNIKNWPSAERPREKLLKNGAQALSDAELLAIFIRNGTKGKTAVDIAREMLKHFGSLRILLDKKENETCSIKGFGQAKYAMLQAALEVSRRYLQEKIEKTGHIHNTVAAQKYFIAKIRNRTQEVFAVLFLDSRNHVISYEEMFFGSINSAAVYPREIVKKAIQYNSAAVIIGHNHTSGVAMPSNADKELTQHLRQALELVEVKLLDHIIIGEDPCYSFAEQNIL